MIIAIGGLILAFFFQHTHLKAHDSHFDFVQQQIRDWVAMLGELRKGLQMQQDALITLDRMMRNDEQLGKNLHEISKTHRKMMNNLENRIKRLETIANTRMIPIRKLGKTND